MSAVSYVEVLGYHLLTPPETPLLEEFFTNAPVLSLPAAVLDQAVKLQGLRRMKPGDALIAATELVHRCELLATYLTSIWRLAWRCTTRLHPQNHPDEPGLDTHRLGFP